MLYRALRLTVGVLLAATVSAPASAQKLRRWFPSGELVPVLGADPREPALGGRLIGVLDAATIFGDGFEGEAQLGHTQPVLRLGGDTPDHAVVLGLQGSVHGRFRMQTAERDLISTDWTFVVPLVIHRGAHWIRVRYRHISSHLGDEYAERFGVERADYSRDAVGATGYARVSSTIGLYGGVEVAINVEPNDRERLLLRSGVDFADRSPEGPGRWFGGIDVQWDQDAEWDPRVNLQTGLRLLPLAGTGVSLVAELGFGPTRQGEFNQLHETVVTLGLLLEP